MTEVPERFVSRGTPAASIPPRARIVDEAYNAIKQMIITNELKSGQVISVAALADYLGVSRSPVSKAFTALEQDGFVESEPFKAPRVAVLTSKFVRNVYGVRTALEARAAADATANLTDTDLSQLSVAFEALSKAGGPADKSAVFEFDAKLHRLFAERADNELLSTFLGNLELHLVRIRNVYGEHITSQAEIERQYEELQRIVRAVTERDAAGVEAAMNEHVSRHAQRLIAKIDEDGRR
ncbi:GntR family transcriptional regulator [Nocardioides bigeumensis]|uniref:GntR family transcriptional regulator n=1 Tax=Nocardioides bigeumensis TaxID=433657 RepID=A0ABN2YPD9_9ACTN